MPDELKRRRCESFSPPPLKTRKVIDSTTTKKTISNFFTPASKKDPDRVTWRIVNDTLLFARYQPNAPGKSGEPSTKRRKVAAFDLDSTLIQTRSGNVFSRDANDWRWWDPVVPGTLQKLYTDGYHICILTNQGSMSLATNPKTIKADTKSLSIFKTKVTAVFGHFDFPILLLAATGRSRYRKPRTGMWMELLEDLDLIKDEKFDLKASVFVGDAGGRSATANRKSDHACSDRDFAANEGIEFKTPEEFFLDQDPAPFARSFEPSDYVNTLTTSTDAAPIVFEKKVKLDIVIMCGSPASGKSTFYWMKLKPLGYERINQDTLKSRDKCVKVANSLLGESTSVAIDNTNADPGTRAVWITLAAKHKIPIRCIYFTAPAKLCEHNDTVRALASEDAMVQFNPEKRTILPHSAFAGFVSRFKEPKLSEGFQDIVKVDFEFQGDEAQKGIWSRYWT